MNAHDGSSRSRARSRTAVLILDVITDLAFPDGPKLLRPALRAAGRIRSFAARARRRGVPVIYVNDQLGMWSSSLPELLERCRRPGSLGRELAAALRPGPDDAFLFKPRHSAFFETPLDTLLGKLGARRLVLTGFSTHQCILFTATDAHVREYELWIPRDCVAAPQASQTRFALRYFEDVLGADVRPALRARGL
jgi:nicotinamidase-related amidase